MKKTNLILIIILSIICCSCTTQKTQTSTSKEQNTYVVIDEYRILNYSNNTWNTKTNLNNNASEWNEFKVYKDTNYLNNYYLKINNGIAYYFDKNYKSYEIDSNLAISSSSSIEPINYTENSFESEDYNIALKLLKKLAYNSDIGLTISKKILVDINQDNKEETLYIISNYSYQTPEEYQYYIIFLRVNNKNIIVVNETDNINLCEPAYFINISNSKYTDIILKYNYAESKEYNVYQYINNEYKLAVEKDDPVSITESTTQNQNLNNLPVIIIITIVIIILLIIALLKKYSDHINKI